MSACCFEGGNRANRHLVVVSINSSHIRMSLQQGRHHFTACVAVEITILGSKENHARSSFDLVVESFLTIDSRGGTSSSLKLDDLSFTAGILDQPVGYALTLLNKVRANEGYIILVR